MTNFEAVFGATAESATPLIAEVPTHSVGTSAINMDSILHELEDRRRSAAKKYLEDPLPQGDQEARVRLQREIEKYDLANHVVDLEIQGYTILPPGKAVPAAFTERLRDTVLRLREERIALGLQSGLPPDLGFGDVLNHLLPDDPMFQQAISNPVVLTLVTYLAGYRAKIATTAGLVKSNDRAAALNWHADNSEKLPAPWPSLSTGANVNWLLTDYSRENGSLCVVPGSHTWCRHPDPSFSHDNELVEIIEVPAGSIVVWHSNLWHAALPRTAEGNRVTFVTEYVRPYWRSAERFTLTLTTTKEMIEGNSPRFSVLTGLLSMDPYGRTGSHLQTALEYTWDKGRWT